MAVEVFNVTDLARRRSTQVSFHIASEDHVRIEFRNMTAGERLAPPAFSGNVVLTCVRGSFVLHSDGPPAPFGLMDQCVMPVDASLEIECSEDGTIEYIWAPPFGAS